MSKRDYAFRIVLCISGMKVNLTCRILKAFLDTEFGDNFNDKTAQKA